MSDGLNISFKIQAIDDFSKVMGDLNRQTKSAFDAVGTVGKGLTAAGVGMAAGLGYAVAVASDFNAQMSRVQAITGATGDDLDALRKSALDLGASTSKSASEVALGMEEMAKKGFEVNDVMAAMPGIIAASEASGEDMALVSNVVASALNSWHMEASEASRIADVMAMAANKTSADINDLGYAFKYAAPIANTLGVSMETLAAATGIMTDAGMKGEQAGTSLRMALIRLSDPPKEAAGALKELGINVTDASGNMLPFDNIIQQLADSTDGMGNAAKLAALSTIFGAEAASGMLTIIDAGPETLREFTSELENSGGSAQETADIMKDNLKGAIEQLSGAFETLMITIGTALTPVLQWLVEKLTVLVEWFNQIPGPVQTALAVMAALTAVFALLAGPILILVSMVPAITAGFTAIAGAVGVTAGVLGGIIATIAGVIAALVLIGVGLVLAYQKVEWFREMVDAAWAWIKQAFFTALEFIKGIVTAIMGEIVAYGQSKLAEFQAFWAEHGAQITQLATDFMNAIKSLIQAGMQFIQGVFEVVWPIISGVVKIAWATIQSVIDTALAIINAVVSTALAIMEGDWEGAWTTIVGIVENLGADIISNFESIDLVQIGKDIIQGLINGIGSMAGAVWDVVSGIANDVKNAAMNALGIHSPSRVMMELGEFTGEGFTKGIASMVRDVAGISTELAMAAVPNVDSGRMDTQPVAQSSSEPESINLARMFEGANITLSNGMDVREMMREAYDYAAQGKRRRGQR